ncbi:MAG: hypothetical protein AB1755_06585 [Candidatus Omnitrophota bacterium]
MIITFLVLFPLIWHPIFGGYLLLIGILFLSVINTAILKHFYEESGRKQDKIPYFVAGINILYLIIRIMITFFMPWSAEVGGYAFIITLIGSGCGILLICVVFVINLYTCE